MRPASYAGPPPNPKQPRATTRAYQAYGVGIVSDAPLPCLPAARLPETTIRIVTAPASRFRRFRSNGPAWFWRVHEPDGTEYLRWSGLFHALVSQDGGTIWGRGLNGAGQRAFETFLASQVISFALLKLGLEPLHATTVVVDGGAVGFLGDCGDGKSTMGAAFLESGYALLTDDQLVLRKTPDGWLAAPGMPRIKLFPRMARAVAHGVEARSLIPSSKKLAVLLPPERFCHAAVPLRALYCLQPSRVRRRVVIRRRPAQEACLRLIHHTFNRVVVEPARLRRQFAFATQVAQDVPVHSLSYPKDLRRLGDVREAVLRHLRTCPG